MNGTIVDRNSLFDWRFATRLGKYSLHVLVGELERQHLISSNCPSLLVGAESRPNRTKVLQNLGPLNLSTIELPPITPPVSLTSPPVAIQAGDYLIDHANMDTGEMSAAPSVSPHVVCVVADLH